MAKTIGLAILLFGMASVASAGGHKPPPPKWCPPVPTIKAPELDPTSATAGLTMLLSGLAVMRGYRSKKNAQH